MSSRLKWCNHAKVRSTTQRAVPARTCPVWRRAISGVILRSRTLLVVVVAAVGDHSVGSPVAFLDELIGVSVRPDGIQETAEREEATA